MKPRTERNLVAAMSLALLPAMVWAQGPAAPTQLAANQRAAPATAAKAPDAAPSSLGQTKDQLTRLPSAADLKPNGPVTIGANHAELVQGNSAIYVGNVTLDSDTLKMDGDRLELKRSADGQYVAKITGSPAHMSHAGNGPDNPPMSARSKTMIYDSRNGIIDLVGEALMTRGNDTTTAETIRYHVLEQRYEASGGDNPNGRVTIVLPQVNASGTPAPAATPPASAPQPAAGNTPATSAAPASGGNVAAPPAKPQDAQQNGPKP